VQFTPERFKPEVYIHLLLSFSEDSAVHYTTGLFVVKGKKCNSETITQIDAICPLIRMTPDTMT
jgi:hypothetical protein